MDKLTSMHFSILLIFIICGNLVPQITAKFYVEVHDRGDEDNVGINLFECNVPNELRRSHSGASPRSVVRSYTTDQDISCRQVIDRSSKQQIYSTTNFHLVVDPRLPGGRRILLGSSRPAPFNIFLGATIIGTEPVDYPALIGNLDESSRSRLRTKCLGLPDHFRPSDRNFETMTIYMSLSNFRQFLDPEQRMVERFQMFNEIVGRVQSHYGYNIIYAKMNKVRGQRRADAIRDVKAALTILVAKLIDPCFVESYIQESNQRLTRQGVSIASVDVANIMCENHCLLMSAAFAIYDVPGSSCRGKLTRGECVNRVCKCEKQSNSWLVACASRPKMVTMIQCSNDLRTGLAEDIDFTVV